MATFATAMVIGKFAGLKYAGWKFNQELHALAQMILHQGTEVIAAR
jgi:hypothetical protein